MKKIGILGSGEVGKTLAAGFLKNGYHVMVGTRTVSKLDDWKIQFGSNLSIGTFKETAQFGDILVLATKGSIANESLKMAGVENFSGKTVIDTSNPIADLPPVNGVLRFFTTLEESLLEKLQTEFPGVNFVKAFNSVGSPFMVDPEFGNTKPTMPICGNNANSRAEVTKILEMFGWEVIDLGMAEAARAIEPLCMLWCIPGFRDNDWSHAFKLLRK